MKLDDDLCAHYLNLDFSDQFLSNDEETGISIELPYPINKPFKSEIIDLIETYIEDLKAYNNQLSVLDKEFHLVKDEVLKQNFDESHVTITNGMLDLCHKQKLSAPFSCNYNPFYASSLLQQFHINNHDYLVRPDYSNNLRITNIGNPRKNAKLKLESNLAEPITGLSVCNGHAIFLLVRQQNRANLLKMTDVKEAVDLKWFKTFKHSLIDSKCSRTQLGVILSNTKLQLYDLETSGKINLNNGDNNVGINFELVDADKISLLGQKGLKLIDQRNGDCKVFTPELNSCDQLCSAKVVDNVVYLSSRHFLLRADVRFEKGVEFCSHLMKHSPCYMDVCDRFLCISGQSPKEKILFSGCPISSLPMSVPNMFETLNSCKLQKDILLKNNVNQRLAKSVAGIKLIEDDDGMCLYSVNCLGDVFKQRITTDSISDLETSVDKLFSWINKLPGSPKTLHLTNVANMSDARFALNKRIQEKNLVKFTKQSSKASVFLNHFNHIYQKDNLSELANNFVSIWDEEEEAEREENDLVPEVAPLDKVSSWIESNFLFN